MVTLQILVLSFLVRIQVAQLRAVFFLRTAFFCVVMGGGWLFWGLCELYYSACKCSASIYARCSALIVASNT